MFVKNCLKEFQKISHFRGTFHFAVSTKASLCQDKLFTIVKPTISRFIFEKTDCPASKPFPYLNPLSYYSKLPFLYVLSYYVGYNKEKILVSITDAAPSMKLATETLRKHYGFTKIQAVTCVAHGLNLVIKVVRQSYSRANLLIESVKLLFQNATSRLNRLRQLAPKLNRPPAPNITRWKPWLEATKYYTNPVNVSQLKNAIEQIMKEELGTKRKREESEQDVKKRAKFTNALDCLSNPLAIQEVNFVYKNLRFIASDIKQLESQFIPLTKAIAIVENVGVELSKIKNLHSAIIAKYDYVFQKNRSYQDFKNFVFGKPVRKESSFNSLNNIERKYILNTPITSTEIERSFSKYKCIYRSNRRRFLFENLKMVVISNCLINRVSYYFIWLH